MKLTFCGKHARKGTARHRNTNPTNQESDTEKVKPVKAGYGLRLRHRCRLHETSGRSPITRVNVIWIAAQAMGHDYALLTANLKNFEGLPGLRVCSP